MRYQVRKMIIEKSRIISTCNRFFFSYEFYKLCFMTETKIITPSDIQDNNI